VSNIIFISIKSHDISIIQENLNDTKIEAEKQKHKIGELVKKGKYYKIENRKLREKIKDLKDTDCFKYFYNFSLFLDEYSDYNYKFYISNIALYETLSTYKTELESYKKAVEKNLFKLTITPAILTNFKNYGIGLDLSIPFRHNYSIVGGIGYFKEFYFKIGLGIKL
jgi:hypothetical protein